MSRQGQGFSDKLYWRCKLGGVYHCLKRTSSVSPGNRKHEFRSLCDKFAVPKGRLGGQGCRRPVPILRCGICDGKEMKRRGWKESGPTLHPKPRTSSITVRKTKHGMSATFTGKAANDLFKTLDSALGKKGKK